MPEHDALQGKGEATRAAEGREAEVRRALAVRAGSSGEPGSAPVPPAPTRRSSRSSGALPLAVVAAGLAVRRVSVAPADVVFVKGLVEASEGLAGVFAEQGGELLLAAPREREAELCELLADLEEELPVQIGAVVDDGAASGLELHRRVP